MTRPLGGKNMTTDALRLPFFLNTIVTSPSSPPSSSSSPALHVSTTTHHWGQAPLDNGSFHHQQDWFNLYCNRCGTTTSTKPYQQGGLRSSHRKAPCFTAAKSKGTARPSWISEQGHQITIPSACPSPSLAGSPSPTTFTRSGTSTRTKLFRAQQLRKSLLPH